MESINVQTGEVYGYDATTQQLFNSQTNLGHNIYASTPIDYEDTSYEPVPLLANGNTVYLKDTTYPIYIMPINTTGGTLGILKDGEIIKYIQPGGGRIFLSYKNKP